MVQVITGSARLARLKSLRVELDREIADEEARLARLERLRGQRVQAKPRPARLTPIPEAPPEPPAVWPPASEATPSILRTWARIAGLPVSDRARIPARIREAYAAAHPDPVNPV